MGTPSTTAHTYLGGVTARDTIVMRDTLVPGFYNDVWYVNKSITASGDGKSWASAFKTIVEALAAAGNYDTIMIAPGFYTEATVLTITQTGLKIKGVNTSGKMRGPCGIKSPTAAGHMIAISNDVNDVEISNLAFIATGAYNAITIGSAASGYCWRTHIHDCAFFGDSVGVWAVANYGATTTPAAGAFPDVAEAVVEDCHFYLWGVGSKGTICLYGTRSMVRRNVIYTVAASTGIVVGTGRPYQTIDGNMISGVNSTDVGIRVTGDNATWILNNNTLLNLSSSVTQDVGIAAHASNNTIYAAATTYAHEDATAA